MLENGLLCVSTKYSSEREIAYIFTDKDSIYAQPLLTSLEAVEKKSVRIMELKNQPNDSARWRV